jgi:aminoglycoside phosphotransferase family enzyme/predicted kinase
VSQALVQALQQPALYEHPVNRFEVIETHISWVLLTGDYAYKIKKPVNFGFLDFSTLAKREYFCREELRLNRRLAPHLYLDIVAIGGTPDSPVMAAATGVFEYAVKMRQFDEAARLDHLLAADKLMPTHIDQLADVLASFHQTVAMAETPDEFGTPDTVYHFVDENFQQIRPLLDTEQHSEQIGLLDNIEGWCQQSFQSLRGQISERKRCGFVREGHGDAHLANMVLIDNEVVLFDCLEFNPQLRWIDVISELAFAVMDLDDRGKPGYGWRLLDRYLQRTGDYDGLGLLRFYQVYRACVRAKVAALQRQQAGSDEEHQSSWKEFCSYLDLAESYTHQTQPVVVCCHGVSGAGKTTVSQQLLEQLPLIRLRSDVERKRLFGRSLDARTPEADKETVYGIEATRETFARLANLAGGILASGFGVIVDATFLRRAEREQFAELARKQNLPFRLLEVTAPDALLRERILQRAGQDNDASEAGLDVLQRQQDFREPLSPTEAESTITVVNDGGLDLGPVITGLKSLIYGKP